MAAEISVIRYVILSVLCLASSLSAFLFLLHAATGDKGGFMQNVSRRAGLVIGLASLMAAIGFFTPCCLKWREIHRPTGIDAIQKDLDRMEQRLLRKRPGPNLPFENTCPENRLEHKKTARSPDEETPGTEDTPGKEAK